MEPLATVLPSAMAALLRAGPMSAGKLAVAWHVAVGPAIERATTVTLNDAGVLTITASSAHWRRELQRTVPVIQQRLSSLLGPDAVASVRIVATTARPSRQEPLRLPLGEPE